MPQQNEQCFDRLSSLCAAKHEVSCRQRCWVIGQLPPYLKVAHLPHDFSRLAQARSLLEVGQLVKFKANTTIQHPNIDITNFAIICKGKASST